MNRFALTAFAVTAVMIAPPSYAQPAQSPAQTSVAAVPDDAEVASIVAAAAAHIEKNYVFKEKRSAIAAALKAAHQSGAYKSLARQELAARMSNDLFAASKDKHMYVKFDPEFSNALSKGAQVAPADGLFLKRARAANHGYVEQKILSGNIRYVKLSLFMWAPNETPAVIDAAARFMADGNAVILDLRGNGGGHVEAVRRLTSYFMKPEPAPLVTFFDGISGTSETSRVIVKLPGRRLTGKPLFVLIDGGVGSAGEEFATHVAAFKFGTLIGEKTAGAANNNNEFALPHGFVVSVSTGRPVHSVTGGNWEGVGVAPDIEPVSAKALDRANLDALAAVAKLGDGAAVAEAKWAMAEVEARMTPVALSAEAAMTYAGTYGERKIWIEGAELMFQRAGRPASALIPLTADLFALAARSDVRLRFRRKDGKIVGFDALGLDGSSNFVERTGN
jgi:hypothetical protein